MAKKRKETVLPKNQASVSVDGDAIAKLAYDLWVGRGCPDGSPEEDWYNAERLLAAADGQLLSVNGQVPSGKMKTIGAGS
jgi:hypothetical protein